MANKRPTESDLKAMGLVYDNATGMWVKRQVSIATVNPIQKIEYTKLQSSEVDNKELIAIMPKGRPNLEKAQSDLYNDGKIKINIKPLSQNDAWQGKRFKSDLYNQYEADLLELLPPLKLPNPPYKIIYEFGFSSKGSDIDNPLKSFGDILTTKYKFNDNLVYEMQIYKKIVAKGKEYISFKIESLK